MGTNKENKPERAVSDREFAEFQAHQEWSESYDKKAGRGASSSVMSHENTYNQGYIQQKKLAKEEWEKSDEHEKIVKHYIEEQNNKSQEPKESHTHRDVGHINHKTGHHDETTIHVTDKGLAHALQEAGVKNPNKVAHQLLANAHLANAHIDEFHVPHEFHVSKEILGDMSPTQLAAHGSSHKGRNI